MLLEVPLILVGIPEPVNKCCSLPWSHEQFWRHAVFFSAWTNQFFSGCGQIKLLVENLIMYPYFGFYSFPFLLPIPSFPLPSITIQLSSWYCSIEIYTSKQGALSPNPSNEKKKGICPLLSFIAFKKSFLSSYCELGIHVYQNRCRCTLKKLTVYQHTDNNQISHTL